jgi:hypothetical protein
MVWVAALAAVQLYAQEPGAAIKEPVPYQVIQRQGFDRFHAHVHEPGGPKLGFADVPVLAEFPGAKDGAMAEVRIVPLPNAFGRGADWTPTGSRVDRGRLAAVVRVSAGGWYRLEIRCLADDREVTAAMEPFGVGEVWVVAGQSYAAGWNQELLRIEDPQGRVVAYDLDGKSWRIANDPLPNVANGGNIWPGLGNILLPLVHVPIGFVDVAKGATASGQWLPGGSLYQRLSLAGKATGKFRAVLWQQGESDVMANTSTAKYVENLTTIRKALASDWGFSPPWLLAKSTLHPTIYNNPAEEQNIRDAIDELWRQPGFFPGPDTDILGDENRGGIGARRHLTGIGQRRAALLWFAAVWELLNPPPPDGK